MRLDAADIAKRLLGKPVTPQRLRKLNKLITRTGRNRDDVIAEIEKADADVAKLVKDSR